MISDLNESIKELLTKRGLLDPAEVDIKFEMPNRSWSASVSKPTVNIYLYDVRENHQAALGHNKILLGASGSLESLDTEILTDVVILPPAGAADAACELGPGRGPHPGLHPADLFTNLSDHT